MKKKWAFVGRLVYYVTWPGLWLYLYGSKRTRIVLQYRDEILVVKSWMGNGLWSLPGGGLKRHEQPIDGAVREIYEETGVVIDKDQLTLLFETTSVNPQRLRYYCYVFGVQLAEKPTYKVVGGEIGDISWQPIDAMLDQPDAERILRPALEATAKLDKM